ncbi:MAG: hypothetical protein KAQ74_04310, partial [Dehalococcoidia bacterium]|nr:hypothetical protein [Dehalococcoidia bacterium]
MKRHLQMRMCAVGVLLSVIVLGIPPAPLLAADESIDLDRGAYAVGDNVRVTGEGFEPSYRKPSGDWVNIYVKLHCSSEWA